MAQIKEPASYPRSDLAETVPEGGGPRNDTGGEPQPGPAAPSGREPRQPNPWDYTPDKEPRPDLRDFDLTPRPVEVPADAWNNEEETRQAENRAAQGIVDQGYTGAGKKGTGFENFNRYLGANMGAAKQAAEAWSRPIKEQGAAFETGMAESAGAAIEAAGKGVTGTGSAGGGAPVIAAANEPTFEVNGQTLTRTQASDLRNATQQQIDGARQRGDNATANALQSVLDTMPSAKDLLGGVGTQPDGTVSPETAKELHDKGGYTGPTSWEGLQDLQRQAADIAGRANQLGSFEGLASRSRELGSTTGGSMLDAALLSSIGGRELGETSRFKGLEEALGKKAEEVGAAIKTGIDTGAANQAELQKALEAYEKQVAEGKVAGKDTSKDQSWESYFSPGEELAKNFINPSRLMSQIHLPKIVQFLINPGPTLFGGGNDNGERGLTGMVAGLLSGGKRGYTAAFRPDEKGVYDSMTRMELQLLEAMPHDEQRAWIEERKKQLGMDTSARASAGALGARIKERGLG